MVLITNYWWPWIDLNLGLSWGGPWSHITSLLITQEKVIWRGRQWEGKGNRRIMCCNFELWHPHPQLLSKHFIPSGPHNKWGSMTSLSLSLPLPPPISALLGFHLMALLISLLSEAAVSLALPLLLSLCPGKIRTILEELLINEATVDNCNHHLGHLYSIPDMTHISTQWEGIALTLKLRKLSLKEVKLLAKHLPLTREEPLAKQTQEYLKLGMSPVQNCQQNSCWNPRSLCPLNWPHFIRESPDCSTMNYVLFGFLTTVVHEGNSVSFPSLSIAQVLQSI